MTPALAPVKQLVPATSSFRDRLRRGEVKKALDNKAVIRLAVEVSDDENFYIVRIPRTMPYADVRTKDAFTDEAGKLHKEAAMLTIVTEPVKDAEYPMSFIDGDVRLDMPMRPSFTMNIGLDFGAVTVHDSENGDRIA